MHPVLRWAVPADAPDHAFLNDGERARLEAHSSPADRRAFVARRWFIREVVAEAAGCAPTEVTIVQRCRQCGGPHGRPTVRTPGRRALFVSWSSADGTTAVAVDRAPVGVDLVHHPELLEWARLEAVLKATGHGLAVHPSLVGLSATRVERWDGPGPRPRLLITDVACGGDLVGAVAARRRRWGSGQWRQRNFEQPRSEQVFD